MFTLARGEHVSFESQQRVFDMHTHIDSYQHTLLLEEAGIFSHTSSTASCGQRSPA